MQETEVAHVQWTRLGFFLSSPIKRGVLYHAPELLPKLNSYLGLSPLYFPAFLLPPAPDLELDPDLEDLFPRGVVQNAPLSNATKQCVVGFVNFELVPSDRPMFLLWGLTLSIMISLLRTGGHDFSHWISPAFVTSNRLFNLMMHARVQTAADRKKWALVALLSCSALAGSWWINNWNGMARL